MSLSVVVHHFKNSIKPTFLTLLSHPAGNNPSILRTEIGILGMILEL
jgi:hypothetical protein